MGDHNRALVHSAVNEYLVIDRYGNYTLITSGSLKCVSRCKPQGVEQVMAAAGLPGVIIC